MQVLMFSPMPPSPSGIADYSAALAGPLSRLCTLEVIPDETRPDTPQPGGIRLYQIGNNACHAPAYRQALAVPGVVVLHEANLHHLVAELTIRAGDWDGYLREAEFDGGAAALERARRTARLEVGPDYEGVPMLRRLLSRTSALITHSDYVLDAARSAGYPGPAARIPHGAWVNPEIPAGGRIAFRRRLGLDETTPLVGVFGHLKPYKRIPETLRAFRRLLRAEPAVKMILVGEPHPELDLDSLIRTLGLGEAVRALGRVPIEEFTGYMAASDVVVNLRFPTAGETSGTLLRALSMGRPALVSDIGAFREFPQEVCIRVPVGEGEEEVLLESLHLLIRRPELARALGDGARQWVERECGWERVASLYHCFLESVRGGRPWPCPEPEAPPKGVPVEPDYVRGWARDAESKDYIESHLDRLSRTLEMVPAGSERDRILEMGAYLQITPALGTRLGYGEVRGCYFGRAGSSHSRGVVSAGGERFDCEIDLFDAEKDRFPYADGYFSCVLCCELIEHLASDPMHMMAEINRVVRGGGYLVLTTPNVISSRAVAAILEGYHPGFFPAYLRPGAGGNPTEAKHNREYTPREIHLLLEAAGFSVARIETGAFRERPAPELHWVGDLLERYDLPSGLRGDGIYALGAKTGPVRDRYPDWLYA